MSNNGYTSEKDMSKILKNAFGISGIEWDIKHPNYEYSGLATCTAKLDGLNISIVAFPLLVGYAQPGVPIYRAHVFSKELQDINPIIDESQIAQYAEKGITLKKVNGKTVFKKTVDAKTHDSNSVNTIESNDLKKAIYEILEATTELERNIAKTEC